MYVPIISHKIIKINTASNIRKRGKIMTTYIMYLRKSRQDDSSETVEEVLSKHENMLQEYALREFGKRIAEADIYREIVSGESIDEREEIKKVLLRIEDRDVGGVVVIEPQRLSRGDLLDCGKLINDFRYTHTKVCTPMMTYDLENKMERKFFQDELMRGRDFLEYTKDILWRGRVAAIKRGCYISAHPPFGYDRIKIGKDWTLTPNDNAELVRQIFNWYVKDGMTPAAIARKITSMGIKAVRKDTWNNDTVKDMLKNVHYIGKVRFNERKETWVVENGERIKRRLKQPDEDVIIAAGLHDGIVDVDIFNMAQAKMAKNPRLKNDNELFNVFAGIIRCQKCGHIMVRQSKSHGKVRLTCRHRPYCFKSAPLEDVENAVLTVLETVELPKLQAKIDNGDGDAAIIQKRIIDKLTKQMADYRAQEETQYELLETGKYTHELFDKRNAALHEKMEECEKQIYLARAAMPKNIDYKKKLMTLEDAIASLRDDSIPIIEKNRLLRAIIDRIEYSAEDLGFNKTDIRLEVFLKL